MPLIQETRQPEGTLGTPQPENDQEPSPEFFSEQIPAAFNIENSLFSAGRSMLTSLAVDDTPQKGYNPLDDVEGYELHQERLADAVNPMQAALIKETIDFERQQRDVLRRSGGTGILATIAAGVFDPIALVPIAGATSKAYKAGESILNVGLKSSASALAAMSVTEATLQASQELRTAEESAINIGTATFLSGILGAGGTAALRKIHGRSVESLVPDVDEFLKVKDNEALDVLMDGAMRDKGADDSVGARRAWEATLKDESLVGTMGGITATKFMNPMLRLATSPSKDVRQFSQNLIENSLFYNKNADGIASPQAVETLMNEGYGRLAGAIDSHNISYKDMRKNGTMMSKQEFSNEISKAMRRGDKHENPFVQQMAGVYRNEVIEPFKKRAIELELLPEDVSVATAESYLTRIWDVERITVDEPRFRAILSDHFSDEVNKMRRAFDLETNQKLTKLQEKVTKGAKGAQKELDEFQVGRRIEREALFEGFGFDDYVEEITDSVIEKLKGMDGSTIPYDIEVATRGPMKERTFNIPDVMVEDFIENDIQTIASRYTRIMGADVELKEKFGTTRFDEAKKPLVKKHIEAMKEAETPAERAALAKRFKKDIKNLNSMWDLVRGAYKHYDPDNPWIKMARTARDYNFIRMLGGVTVSSIPDMAMPILNHGFARYVTSGLKPLLTGLRGVKMSVAEAKKAGQVVETTLHSRLMTMAELADPYARGTAFERFSKNATHVFSRMSGIAYWNNAMKAVSSTITQDRVLSNSLAKSLGKRELEYMSFLGVDDAMRGRIAKMFNKHGEVVDGVKVANTQAWDDLAAVRVYRAAISKDVNRTIVTKTAGDVPIFMNTELGKTMMQFRTFVMASHQKLLLQGLQRKDAHTIQGMLSMLGLGMLVYYLKTVQRGAKVSDDPNKWLVEGIDRSGIIAVLMEVNNLAEKARVPGLAAIAGQPPASRFAARTGAETLAGPTFGTAVNIMEVSAALNGAAFGDEKISKRDVHNIRKLIPFQNLIGVRHLFDKAEDMAR